MTKERKSPEPKLPYEITNIDALQAARPELVSEESVNRVVTIKGQIISNESTHRKFVAKSEQSLLYQLVKLNHRLNVETPGITIGKAEPAPAGDPAATAA